MMQLITAPNVMLQTPVKRFDFEMMHPAPFALDMIDLMKKEGGLGLSANQVGLNAQIFIMTAILNKQYGNITVVMNPIIRGLSSEKEIGPEGCLSHPDLFLQVKRPRGLVAKYLDTDAKECIIELYDIDARCFLHEFDHLYGIEFVDRVSKLKLELARKKQFKRIKNGRTK
jgi:peptide deformylase